MLTPQLDILAEIDDYESLVWARRWHRPGEFEMHINRHKNSTDTLELGNLLMLSPTKAGIIRHKEISLDQGGKGSEQITVRGPTLQGIAGQRITVPPTGQAYDTTSGAAEAVMKHYVAACLTSPTDQARKVSLLALAANQNRGEQLSWQSRYKNLAEELEKISNLTNLGWNVTLDFDQQKWIFDIIEGRDLTAGQDVCPPVIFSPDFDNIKSQYFVDSEIGYKNVAYVAGQGEGVDREIAQVGDGEGLGLHETFVDARDIEETDELPARGEQNLQEMTRLRTFESDILTEQTFRYEKDWDLGDLVTVVNKNWGLRLNSRITEAIEVYEPSGFKLRATFGNAIPTLIDKIKQKLTAMESEVTR